MLAASLLAVVLTLPALWTGLHSDDYAHRLAVRGDEAFPAQRGTPMHLFSFADGDPVRNAEAMDSGLFPWWTLPQLRLNFWRPLTALTHMLDYGAWPNAAAWMHLHNLLWFAALVAVAGWFYRRILGPTSIAGVAVLLFAIDDAHAQAVTWLASRNSLMVGVFAILAVIAHDQWRRDGRLRGAIAAPVLLLLGLLAGEAAVAAGAFLLAYALFLDRGRWPGRLASLLPTMGVGAAWQIAYAKLGYGTFGSGLYVNPGREPVEFLAALVERVPPQILAQWALPPAEFWLLLSADVLPVALLVAVAFAAGLAGLLWPVLRSDARARFFAVAMLLSLVPNCATIPVDRMLILVGLAGMGLLALFIDTTVQRAADLPRGRRIATRVALVTLLAIHGVLAPLLLPIRCWQYRDASVPLTIRVLPEISGDGIEHIVFVNAPSGLWGTFLRLVANAERRPLPARIDVLASSQRGLEIERSDEHTLLLRQAGGFLVPPRTAPAADATPPPISIAYMFQQGDLVHRGPSTPFERDNFVQLDGRSVRITDLTGQGDPAEIRFRLDVPLDDTSVLWMRWEGETCVPFTLPAVGETVSH